MGFDRRNWTVAEQSAHSVTFTLLDKNGTQEFPGNVKTTVGLDFPVFFFLLLRDWSVRSRTLWNLRRLGLSAFTPLPTRKHLLCLAATIIGILKLIKKLRT